MKGKLKMKRFTTKDIRNVKEYLVNGETEKFLVVLNGVRATEIKEFYVENISELPLYVRKFIENSKREIFFGYDPETKRKVYRYKIEK